MNLSNLAMGSIQQSSPFKHGRIDGQTAKLKIEVAYTRASVCRSAPAIPRQPPAEAGMAESSCPWVGELSPAQGDHEGASAEHRVRGRALPQHRRVLASRHGDLHDPR